VVADIEQELHALAEAMVAYGRPRGANMCFTLIEQVQAIRESNGDLDVELAEYITNVAAFNERLADQSGHLDKLQERLDKKQDLLMTYNARNLYLTQAIGEVLASQHVGCEECKGTLKNALAETRRMHVKMEGPTS
jgi:CII-binding regulator of phage lambda lysogenization HflD